MTATILRRQLAAIGAVWRDHLDAVSTQLLIQRIAIVGAITDQILRLGFDHVEVEAQLHQAFGAFVTSVAAVTIGTNTATPSAGSAKRPSFAARIQLNRCCELMSCRRAISATGTPALSDSATIRPFSSAVQRRRRPPGAYLHPPKRKLRVAYSVGHMCKTFPPNQREACDIPRASIKVGAENRLRLVNDFAALASESVGSTVKTVAPLRMRMPCTDKLASSKYPASSAARRLRQFRTGGNALMLISLHS